MDLAAWRMKCRINAAKRADLADGDVNAVLVYAGRPFPLDRWPRSSLEPGV